MRSQRSSRYASAGSGSGASAGSPLHAAEAGGGELERPGEITAVPAACSTAAKYPYADIPILQRTRIEPDHRAAVDGLHRSILDVTCVGARQKITTAWRNSVLSARDS